MDVIFIYGCSPRSGTNFIFNILREHKDTILPNIKNEDFLLINSNLLVDYHIKTKAMYPEIWKNDHINFNIEFGKSLIKILIGNNENSQKKIITKTPTPLNIKNADVLFPKEKKVLVLRNGPDTIESYQKTFRKPFEESLRTWKFGSETILKNKHLGKVFKYESFNTDFVKTVTDLLNFVELEIENYSFDNAERIGVVGSTQQTIDNKVSWAKELEKSKDFNPSNKWENWSIKKKWRYNYLCGELDSQLGYYNEIKITGFQYPYYLVYNYLSNIKYLSKKIIKRLFHE